MNSIKYIFFDFNGTLIDDVKLCLDLLNEMLRNQHKKELSILEYKNIFCFPIEEYYKKAGIDFSLESFESLSIKFINKYQPMSMECGLFPNTIDTLNKLKKLGYKLIILSASEKNNLLEQCNHYKLTEIFDDILGIDNIHARSKVNIAINYCQNNNINGDEILFIGDTLHDYEVSKELECHSYLVSCGHQSKEVLSKANTLILDNINELLEVLNGNN